MAGSVNKVILIGNLGADPEIRRTQDGRPGIDLESVGRDVEKIVGSSFSDVLFGSPGSQRKNVAGVLSMRFTGTSVFSSSELARSRIRPT